MLQQPTADSLAASLSAPMAEGGAVRHSGPPTVAQVLSWLPAGATPAQQDSMVRAHVKVDSVTHWSQRPDTLHLPGMPAGKSIHDVSLPQYYRESFFSGDSLFHPELRGGRLGVAGDPIPYTVAGDNLITSVLIFCVWLTMFTVVRSKRFIAQQAKNFFFQQKSGPTTVTETGDEVRFQLLLVLQTCLLLAIGFFFYDRERTTTTYVVEQYQVIGLYAAVFVGYFALRALAYWVAGWVFFDARSNEQWLKAHLFLGSTEGVAVFPVILLQAYFGLSMSAAITYALVVVVAFKLLAFYKTYLIFFQRTGLYLQIILYFCALEIIPLSALWGTLTTLSSILKINI